MNYASVLVAEATETERSLFYKRVYGHLAAAVILFIIVESILMTAIPSDTIASMFDGFTWLFIIGGFWVASLFANKWAKAKSKSVQYAGLGFYIIAEAIIFLPLLLLASNVSGEEVIAQASILTFALFGALTAIVFLSKQDFSFMRTILVVGGFLSLGLIVAGIAFGFELGLWFSVGMILLASGSILYETYQIKNEYNTDQYVGASLSLFASVMLLLWYIIRLFISSDD